MAARPQLPGMRWFLWLRVAPLRLGVLTGIYLSCVFVGWLIVANRVPALWPFAGVRNAATGIIMLLVLGIPVIRFRQEPGRLFLAGLVAWTLLTMTYLAAELHYTLLESRVGAFHIFVLGVVSYGIVAVSDWVFLMCAGCRHQYVGRSRESASSAGRHGTH
jgi:hypothetical protein